MGKGFDMGCGQEIWLPKHLTLSIGHNDHKNYYDSIDNYLDTDKGYGQVPAWKNEEQKNRAVSTDEIWTMHWYPDTPVGSYYIAAPTLSELLAFALEVEKDEK